MVATIATATDPNYYKRLTEYYEGGREPNGRWLAVGFDISAKTGEGVDHKLFGELCAARGPHGEPLIQNSSAASSHVAGYDLTLSAPKSVSVLFAMADDSLRAEIDAAQEAAAQATIKLIERQAAFCRRGKNGHEREPVKLTIAAFRHAEARPDEHGDGANFGDPQLHTHCLIMNVSRRTDGSFGALDGKAFFKWKMAAGAIYHAELAVRLQCLGLAIDKVGKNGIFELAGIDESLLKHFSARRTTIEKEMRAAGTTTAEAPALAAAVTKATRKSKADLDNADRFAFWQQQARARGHEPDKVIAHCFAASSANVAEKDKEDALSTRLTEIAENLTDHESYFEHRKLVAEVAAAHVGTGIGADGIEKAVDRVITESGLIQLGTDAWGHAIWTTPEMKQIEQDVVTLAAHQAHRKVEFLDPCLRNLTHAGTNLSNEQITALQAMTGSCPLSIVEGAAGSGKTSALRPAVDALKASGYRVIGTAVANKIVNMLRADLDIEAHSTAEWISRAEHGMRFVDERTALIVDEAGQLSSRQMQEILRNVAHAGGDARVIIVGDRDQLQAIGAGPGLDLVTRAVDPNRIDTIVRQKHAWARQVVRDFREGKADDALTALEKRGHVRECVDEKTLINELLDHADKLSEKAKDGKRPLLLAKTNTQARKLSQAVRERLRQKGILTGPDVNCDSLGPTHQCENLALTHGDRIRFRLRNDRLGVINGTEGVIHDIEVKNDVLTRLSVNIGKRRVNFAAKEISDSHGWLRLSHAYASTVYSSQGLTCESALIWADPTMNRHDIYVAASRARETTDIFLDRNAVEQRIKTDSASAAGKDQQAPNRSDCVGYLGKCFASANYKISTLDVEELARARTRPLSDLKRGLNSLKAKARGVSGGPPLDDRHVSHGSLSLG